MKALIDGDILTYRCGFACQKTVYYVYPRGENNHVFCTEDKKELDAWIDENSGEATEDQFETYLVLRVEPIENCLHTVKQVINSILAATKADSYQIYLTGGNQFREKIATIKPYKGNRDPNHKPVYYKDIREYLVKRWSAHVTDVIEADDALAMAQTSDTVICSLDKDLKQVPGLHYNFVHETLYSVPDGVGSVWIDAGGEFTGNGKAWFYAQLIMGDATDNIQGVPKKGPKAAYNALKDLTTEWDMYQAARKLYVDYYKDEKEADRCLLENARLLYLLKHEHDEWSPPKENST